MKRFTIGIVALMIGAGTATAQIELGLRNLERAIVAESTVFTFDDIGGTPTFTSTEGFGSPAISGNLTGTGVGGSIEITWTAQGLSSTNGLVRNPEEWAWGPTADCATYAWTNATGTGYNLGLGVRSRDAVNVDAMFPTETLLLSINTNNVTGLGAQEALVIRLKTNKKAFDVYKRVGANSGVLIAQGAAANPAVYSEPFWLTSENGYLEFAVDAASFYTEIQYLEIDVISTIPETPTGLIAVPRDGGAILDWDDNIPGTFNNYTLYRSETTGVATNNYDWKTNLTDSVYSETNLINGTDYYYAVTVTDILDVETAISAEVMVTPAALSTETKLLMHYDASIAASVITNTFGVTNWLNQVGGDYTATVVPDLEGVLYPSTNLSRSGEAGLDFTEGDTRLNLMNTGETDVLFNNTGTNSGFVVVMALRLDEQVKTNGFAQYIIANSSTTTNGFGIRKKGNDDFDAWLGTDLVTLETSAVTGSTVVVSFRYDSADLEFELWESASGNSVTKPRYPTDNTSAAFNLGCMTANNWDFEGQLFEVKVWGSTLDDETLAAEQSAMVRKWAGTGYSFWAEQWGEDGIGDDTEDDNADGIININEYALGGDPTNGVVEPAVLPTIQITESGLEYVHVQRNDDTYLTYTVKTTDNLVSPDWQTATIMSTNIGTGAGLLDTVTNVMESVENEQFIQLIITQ